MRSRSGSPSRRRPAPSAAGMTAELLLQVRPHLADGVAANRQRRFHHELRVADDFGPRVALQQLVRNRTGHGESQQEYEKQREVEFRSNSHASSFGRGDASSAPPLAARAGRSAEGTTEPQARSQSGAWATAVTIGRRAGRRRFSPAFGARRCSRRCAAMSMPVFSTTSSTSAQTGEPSACTPMPPKRMVRCRTTTRP